MQKTASIGVLAIVALALTGCSLLSEGPVERPAPVSSSPNEPTETQIKQESPVEPAAPAEVITSEYAVTIDGAQNASDYKGAPVVIVSYSFTNNSDKAESFMLAANTQAFQGGIELSGFVMFDLSGDSPVDSSLLMANVQPGATIQLKEAFELRDSSDVSVLVQEAFSFDTVELASKTFSVS